jgi:hypothetical protein
VLVDEADAVEGGPGDDHRGGVGLHDPGAQEVGERDAPGGVDPGGLAVLVADEDAAGGHLGPAVGAGRGGGGQGGHLALQLLRQPLVVVVAEGDQLAGGGEHAGVAGAGQARGAVVGDDPQLAPGRDLDLDGVRLRLVEDDHALDGPGVVLVHHPLHGPAQQHGPLPGGDDDADLGQGGAHWDAFLVE